MKPVSFKTGDVILVIDVLNTLDFKGGEKILPWGLRMAPLLKKLLVRARRSRVPVIYANDNFGEWRDDLNAIFKAASKKGARGSRISKLLKPLEPDYFILKPMHSAFFCTSLKPLLKKLHVRRIFLSGIATNLCVLFTAHDAHMEEYKLVVISDCCAAESDFDHNVALQQLKSFCRATICRSIEIEANIERSGRIAERSRTTPSHHTP